MTATLNYTVGDRIPIEVEVIYVDTDEAMIPYKVSTLDGGTTFWITEGILDKYSLPQKPQETVPKQLDRHTVKVISDYFDEVIQFCADDSDSIMTLAGYFDGLEAVFKD